MGSTAFPSTLYPCILADGYEADKFDAVTVQQARDLSELRLYHGTGWRASFSLLTRNATERTALRSFRDARYGAWDSFPFTSPDDSVVRQVRFEECSGQHLGRGIWRYRIVLTQVA